MVEDSVDLYEVATTRHAGLVVDSSIEHIDKAFDTVVRLAIAARSDELDVLICACNATPRWRLLLSGDVRIGTFKGRRGTGVRGTVEISWMDQHRGHQGLAEVVLEL